MPVTWVLFDNVKPPSVVSKQIPCHFPPSCLNFFPFVVIPQRCSKHTCIKRPYPVIYAKWQTTTLSEERMGGMLGLCPNEWFAADQWGNCEVDLLTALWFSSQSDLVPPEQIPFGRNPNGSSMPEATRSKRPRCLPMALSAHAKFFFLPWIVLNKANRTCCCTSLKRQCQMNFSVQVPILI